MRKIGVILSGSGVYDGTEIQEACMTLLAIAHQGGEAICMAPNINQHHVINHLNGEEMEDERNVLIESARIARGNIMDISDAKMKDLDALVIPGGFGAAKNLSSWAFQGPEGEINLDVQRLILEALKSKKPIGAMCMGPTLVAKATAGSGYKVTLTVGSDEAESPYDIKGISTAMESSGTVAVMKTVHQIAVDTKHKVVSAPCYMMEAGISDIHRNIEDLMSRLFDFLR